MACVQSLRSLPTPGAPTAAERAVCGTHLCRRQKRRTSRPRSLRHQRPRAAAMRDTAAAPPSPSRARRPRSRPTTRRNATSSHGARRCEPSLSTSSTRPAAAWRSKCARRASTRTSSSRMSKRCAATHPTPSRPPLSLALLHPCMHGSWCDKSLSHTHTLSLDLAAMAHEARANGGARTSWRARASV